MCNHLFQLQSIQKWYKPLRRQQNAPYQCVLIAKLYISISFSIWMCMWSYSGTLDKSENDTKTEMKVIFPVFTLQLKYDFHFKTLSWCKPGYSSGKSLLIFSKWILMSLFLENEVFLSLLNMKTWTNFYRSFNKSNNDLLSDGFL